MTFDVDIICIAVAEKQPFHFKRAPVNGVSYSILYSYLTAYQLILSGTAAFIELGNKISKITKLWIWGPEYSTPKLKLMSLQNVELHGAL